MEELNKGYKFTKAQIAELESLRAWKAEIEKQEPVGKTIDATTNTGYVLCTFNGRGTPVGTKLYAAPAVSQQARPLPFAILPSEMADLQRFHECVTDGEGYDVPKERMKLLAEIGLVRRVSANYYEHTKFGLSVINGDFSTPVVSPDVEKVMTNWKGLYERERNLYDKLSNESQSLKTELKAARKDADRYRWLRNDPPVWLAVRRFPGETPRGCYLDGRNLDDAIDEAIEQAKGGA